MTSTGEIVGPNTSGFVVNSHALRSCDNYIQSNINPLTTSQFFKVPGKDLPLFLVPSPAGWLDRDSAQDIAQNFFVPTGETNAPGVEGNSQVIFWQGKAQQVSVEKVLRNPFTNQIVVEASYSYYSIKNLRTETIKLVFLSERFKQFVDVTRSCIMNAADLADCAKLNQIYQSPEHTCQN
jgi:hypothetical protein